MSDPKREKEEKDLVLKIFEEVYGIPKEEVQERHVDSFGSGEDLIAYTWNAKDDEDDKK